MKLNKCTKIIGKRVILVPYRKSHVPKYHGWMESKELRIQTASERLSLKEEYSMQQTWLHDENKCTFIVLSRVIMDSTNSEEESMIGDANLYIKDTEEGLTGEVGVMIAEKSFRKNGLGKEATLSLLRYGVEQIKLRKFIAIISLDNEVSIKLFQKLNFVVESKSEVFREITLACSVDDNWRNWLLENTANYCLAPTEENV